MEQRESDQGGQEMEQEDVRGGLWKDEMQGVRGTTA